MQRKLSLQKAVPIRADSRTSIMKPHNENEPSRKKPTNKATMDQPQEEFIQGSASVVDPEEEPGSVPELTAQDIHEKEQSGSAK